MEGQSFSLDEISNMDNIEFWLRQFTEHSLFIKIGIVELDLETRNIKENAEKWQKYWKKTLQKHLSDIDVRHEIKNSAINFSKFKTEILDLTKERFTGWLVPEFIHHIKDEVEYFLKREFKNNLDNEFIIRFWNEINQEHSEFNSNLLDNSEKELIEKSDNFAKRFEVLKNLEEFEVIQFTLLSLHCAEELDDFLTSGKEGIEDRSIKSAIHPVLIEHVKRETQRGIFEMNEILKDVR